MIVSGPLGNMTEKDWLAKWLDGWMKSKNRSLQTSHPGVAVVHFNIKEEEEEAEEAPSANARKSVRGSCYFFGCAFSVSNFVTVSKFTT